MGAFAGGFKLETALGTELSSVTGRAMRRKVVLNHRLVHKDEAGVCGGSVHCVPRYLPIPPDTNAGFIHTPLSLCTHAGGTAGWLLPSGRVFGAGTDQGVDALAEQFAANAGKLAARFEGADLNAVPGITTAPYLVDLRVGIQQQ